MLILYQPPAYVQQEKADKKPDIQQKSSGDNSPNVITGNNSTVNINTAPTPQFLKSISEVGAKAAMVVRSGKVNDDPLVVLKAPQFTGFWVDAGGYAATCVSASEPPPVEYPHIVATVVMPPLPGDRMEWAGGEFNVPAKVAARSHDVAILYAPGINEERVSFLASDSKTGKSHETDEYAVAELSPLLPHVGDQVFLVGAEPGLDPRLSTFDGSIVSVGPGMQGGIRIFAKLPFKPSYCGAPIFNSKKQIIGLLEQPSENSGEIVAIPAIYIIRSLRELLDQ